MSAVGIICIGCPDQSGSALEIALPAVRLEPAEGALVERLADDRRQIDLMGRQKRVRLAIATNRSRPLNI
jgi:hypothetical protein